jgi:hypothetical protein
LPWARTFYSEVAEFNLNFLFGSESRAQALEARSCDLVLKSLVRRFVQRNLSGLEHFPPQTPATIEEAAVHVLRLIKHAVFLYAVSPHHRSGFAPAGLGGLVLAPQQQFKR